MVVVKNIYQGNISPLDDLIIYHQIIVLRIVKISITKDDEHQIIPASQLSNSVNMYFANIGLEVDKNKYHL